MCQNAQLECIENHALLSETGGTEVCALFFKAMNLYFMSQYTLSRGYAIGAVRLSFRVEDYLKSNRLISLKLAVTIESTNRKN